MVKDRLPELQEKRASLPHSKTKSRAGDTSIKSGFLEQASALQDIIEELRRHVAEATKIQKDILASPQQDSELDRRLQSLTKVIRDNALHVRATLKTFEDASDKSPLLGSVQDRVKSTQHASLSRQLVAIMNDYNKSQLEYRDKCKLRIRNQLAVAGSMLSEDEIEDMLEKKNPEIFTQAIMASTEAAKRSLCDIEARHADIIRLEKSVEELRDLFTTLALTVDQQGELIDRIEFHVSKTTDSVENANRCLNSAVTRQSKYRKRKLICIIILIILGVFLIVAIASAIGLT
ncbi:Syntaxin-1A [Clonorchis sinensis]|uniref:Syntaxin-1A n=2 Tax=Clonorchis sinensis TaxID=79923 RepID=A0A8T1MT43_CLOSI|nr:Syntaxin-1A [Clonorchis sinensis]